MLRANVGLSRKISRDYQSTGYTVNVEGEIGSSSDDPGTALKKIQELFKLAEHALDQEIDRDQGEQAIGRRDEPPNNNGYRTNGNGNGNGSSQEFPDRNANTPPPSGNGREEGATNKQLQYLQTLGKRQNLSKANLEDRIQEVLGQRIAVYQLTKREAGRVIDSLTQNGSTTEKSTRR